MSRDTYSSALYDAPQIDHKAGIIRGVSVMTAGEVPDRGTYADMRTLQMLKIECDKYVSGVKVKADHKSGIFGTAAYLKNFRIEGNQLKADLYVLESEENRAKLFEMASEIPDTFGLSVSIEQEIEEVAGRLAIRPTAVDSIDLVTEPAANPAGLFSKQVDANPKQNNTMTDSEFKALCDKFDLFSKEVKEKMSKYDAALWPETPAANTGGEAPGRGGLFAQFEKALNDTKAEFAKQLKSATEDTAKTIAAEFSKVVGTSTVKVGTDSAASDEAAKKEKAANSPEAFEARVQEHFAKSKNKGEAMSAAIKDDNAATGGKGHAAFIAQGRSVKYSK